MSLHIWKTHDGEKRAMRKFFFRPRIIWSYLKMVRNPLIALRGAYLLSQYVLKKQFSS